ncbi:MAG: hypothetical protein H8E71_00820 [Candidatus Marinimicrobia bacterium]|nr:hypothetical protein [Candidatus Neomarinimicrobiota bacterium]
MKQNPQARSMIPILIILLIFIGNQIAQSIGFYSHFSSSYLDDLICFPIVFFIIQWVHRQLYDVNFKLPVFHLFIGVLFFSIIFEIILPQFSNKYTGDFYDIGFYIFGAIIFYFINTSNIQSVLTLTPPDN